MVHGKEPPPREILEDVSAKGGNLLSRTIENYMAVNPRYALADEHDEVPKANMLEVDSQSTGRIVRGEYHWCYLQLCRGDVQISVAWSCCVRSRFNIIY